MAISTYAELQTALQNYTGRSDSAFTNLVPEFISQAENYINREIHWNPGITEATVSLSAFADTAALPAGFLEIIDLKYPSNDYFMRQIALDKLLGIYDDNEVRPNYFAVADTFRFNAPSDAAYSLDCNYYKKWDIAADSTNELMTQYEDVYLDMSLWRAFKWMRNAEQANAHFATADGELRSINKAYGRSKRRAMVTVDAGLQVPRKTTFNINNGY